MIWPVVRHISFDTLTSNGHICCTAGQFEFGRVSRNLTPIWSRGVGDQFNQRYGTLSFVTIKSAVLGRRHAVPIECTKIRILWCVSVMNTKCDKNYTYEWAAVAAWHPACPAAGIYLYNNNKCMCRVSGIGRPSVQADHFHMGKTRTRTHNFWMTRTVQRH